MEGGWPRITYSVVWKGKVASRPRTKMLQSIRAPEQTLATNAVWQEKVLIYAWLSKRLQAQHQTPRVVNVYIARIVYNMYLVYTVEGTTEAVTTDVLKTFTRN